MPNDPLNIQRSMDDMAHRQFEAYAHRFFDRWQPKDEREAAEFSAELFALVRQIYRDASAEQNALISKIVNLLPPVMHTISRSTRMLVNLSDRDLALICRALEWAYEESGDDAEVSEMDELYERLRKIAPEEI